MRRIIIVLAVLAAAVTAAAQGTVKVQAPDIVSADEQFNVTFIIEGEKGPNSFTWEPGSDFQLIWGPQKGFSSSTSIVNGKTTRSSQTTYTYILQARTTGKFTLPAATASFKGGDVSSRSFTIEVLSAGANKGSSAQQGQGQSRSQAAATGDISAGDLFLRLSLSRSNVVVGEPVTAVLKIYQRVNVAGFEDVKFPSFNGFWSQEVQTPTNIDFKRENVGGEIYNAAVLRSWVLIPQQAGSIEIDPAELVCLVNIRTQSRSNSIFDSFFDDGYRTIRKRLNSDRLTVRVNPLPSGAPASFGGGVGSFKMQASLGRDSLKTHEAASLEITLSGRGNVSLLEAPKLHFPLDFETYDVKVTDRTDKSSGRTSGSKTFEYPFIPRSGGDFVIEPVEYSYYDIDAHKYVTLRTEPIEVHVEKGEGAADSQGSGQMVQGMARRDVRDLGADIRFIRTKTPALASAGRFFCGSPLFVAIALALVLAAAAVYLLARRDSHRKADVAGTRRRRASAVARRRLSSAGEYLQKDLYTAFYEELHKALTGYAGDRLGMDLSQMSREGISERLSSSAGSSLTEEFISLLDACEYARYAPSSGHEAMDEHYQKALQVISAIDDKMKSSHSRGKAALLLLLLLPGMHAAAQGDYPDSLWRAGVQAYTDGAYAEAAGAWRSIEALGVESAGLYYNIGNACFKTGDIAHAILYYERALKLDPSDADVRFNLAYAQEFTQDHIEAVPEFFLKTWFKRLSYSLSSGAWAVLALLALAGALALALLFLLSGRAGARRAGFFGGITALLLSVLCFANAQGQKKAYFRADSAIVTRTVTSAKSSPGAALSATDLFVLHEGTKVRLLDSVGQWYQIEIADGRQGWLPAEDLEII